MGLSPNQDSSSSILDFSSSVYYTLIYGVYVSSVRQLVEVDPSSTFHHPILGRFGDFPFNTPIKFHSIGGDNKTYRAIEQNHKVQPT